MEDIAISLENVSKKYRLFNSPHERLTEALHPFNKKYHKEFWALTDINLTIKKGLTVGIIGRNGAGKSTLLQVLCSILRPTSGNVTVNGRVSAILALGAGFNPEFTGRQNVLLNGSLMGFSETEMKKRLPDIENFADIGEFIDQPMKIYSSGMSVRLAFAAAINVDPDILILDEAMAVGDAKFQHKCYEKFLEFQRKGKTIILVTHDTESVIKHCDMALLLEKGEIIEIGQPKKIVNYYVDLVFNGKIKKNTPEQTATSAPQPLMTNGLTELDAFLTQTPVSDNCIHRKTYNKNEYRQGYNKAEIIDYFIVANGLGDPGKVNTGDKVDIYIKAKFHYNVKFPLFGFSIKTIDGIMMYALNSYYIKAFIKPAKASQTVIAQFSVKLDLNSGDYFIDLGIDEAPGSIALQWFNKHSGYESLDRRCSIIHLNIQNTKWFNGYVDLDATFKEVTRQ